VAGWGSFSIFFPVYLCAECDISYAQVGILVAAPLVVGIFSGTLWSLASDAIGKRKPFLVQSAILLSLFTFAVTLVSTFEGFLFLGLLRAIATPIPEGLIVATLFGSSGHRTWGTAYSRLAIWGSLGWATATTIAGILARVFDTYKVTMYFATLLFCTAIIPSLKISEAPKETRAELPYPVRRRTDSGYLVIMREIMGNKKIETLFLFSFPLILAMNAAGKFFPIYLDSLGGSSILIGLAFAVASLLEIPIFLHVGKMSDRIGARKPLLIFSSGAYGLLYLLVALIPNPLLLFFIYISISPLAWPSFITGSTTLISEALPPDKWVTGQNLFNIWMWSIGGIFGPLIGGFISETLGLRITFVIASIFGVTSMALLRWIRERNSPRDRYS